MHRPKTTAPRARTFRTLAILLGAIVTHANTVRAAAPPAPFSIGGDPSVDPSQFRLTTFASGLAHPYGMQQLSDGSLLVGESTGNYFSAPSQLIRLTDTNGDGAADGPGTVLASNLPARATALRVAGDLVFLNDADGITVMKMGATPSTPFTTVGTISLGFPQGWEHVSYSLETRPTPGQTGKTDLFFNIGSEQNAVTTPADHVITASGLLSATLHGDSIYKVTVSEAGNNVTVGNPTQIAIGLRNAAGLQIQKSTGDLYLEDNGIDGLVDPQEPESADELNVIHAADIGTGVVNFGFATDYIKYRTGQRIGSGGVQPIVAFQPIPDPLTGSESEGPSEFAFAPSGFPTGLNDGVFIGFYGRYAAGIENEENPLVYYDFASGKYFDFIGNDEAAIGHLTSSFATTDSLFVADLSPTNNFGSATDGAIYQIKSLTAPTVPEPAAALMAIPGLFAAMASGAHLRRQKQRCQRQGE